MFFCQKSINIQINNLTLRFDLEVNFLVLLDAISVAVFYTDEEKFMMKLPEFLKQGETARLFPVLADTSKEGRVTSILLSCMKKLTTALCLTIAVLLGSVGVSWGAENVSGTNWKVDDADGDITVYNFSSNGRCTYFQAVSRSGNQGKIYNNCRWAQNDSVLAYNTNGHFRSCVAIIEGPTMRGFCVTNLNKSGENVQGNKVD